jgi:DNA primase
MMKFKVSPEFLQKIKDSTNLIEIVGEHVVLRKSGANFVGLCPFHSERTPSFSVSENKQLYHCYGCKKGGDLVSFVMEMMGLSFVEAVEDLAERARIPLPKEWAKSEKSGEVADKRSAEREKQALSFKLNRFAAAFFHQNLRSSPSSVNYFSKRGVGEDSRNLFYLGTAPDSWDALAKHLVSKKAPIELAIELGLIRPSTKKSPSSPGFDYFDLFRNRVIFPILNLSGKVAGFGGRALGDQTPKYLNSTESLVFHKGKLAFGLYQAQKYIRELDEIILVEGYFDVLALHAAGFRNVVATCGTSFTPDHLTLFKRFANRVTVLFDGDSAGLSATERAMEVGLDHGFIVYGAQMPKDLDPDELVLNSETGEVREEGKEQMSSILSQAKPLLDARIDESIQSAHQSPEDRAQALKKIGAWLARFNDSVGREVRMQLIEKQLGISRNLLHEAMGKKFQTSSPSVGSSAPSPVIRSKNFAPGKVFSTQASSPAGQIGKLDRILLSGLVFGGEYHALFSQIRGDLPPKIGLSDLFDYGPARAFVATILNRPELLEKLRSVPESLFDGGLDMQVRAILTEVLVSADPPMSLNQFRGALYKSLEKNWARFSQYIKAAITDAELKKDAGLQTQLMKEYLDVQRKMKEFSSFYDEE